ncbi:uncharacterized protein LOC143673271 isoform X5 [Tamandua tetradactyla]|uniref:uncharacterized protein LOC143673271 isoform X5 n=1 Tax=Tamandua tetradactyla TaxID=48850 RepID=UPI00405460BC
MERERRGWCGTRPRPGERAAGHGAAVAVFPVRVPRAPWGRWNPQEGLRETMRKFNIRKGLDCLNAGLSLAAPPPPPSAPPSNQEPEIAETLQARISSSARDLRFNRIREIQPGKFK